MYIQKIRRNKFNDVLGKAKNIIMDFFKLEIYFKLKRNYSLIGLKFCFNKFILMKAQNAS